MREKLPQSLIVRRSAKDLMLAAMMPKPFVQVIAHSPGFNGHARFGIVLGKRIWVARAIFDQLASSTVFCLAVLREADAVMP